MAVKAQFKIQQMIFMILAVFLLFVFVGLFFVKFQMGSIKSGYSDYQTEQAITSLALISNMMEFRYSSSEDLTLDEDKLLIMSGNFSKVYSDFWPVASIKVYKVYPKFEKVISCPAANCNYYEIYDSGQKNIKEQSTFVSICKKVRESYSTYDRCEIGKLVVGVINAEN